MLGRRIARYCAYLAVSLLVLVALFITALRFGVPDLQPHRAWVLREILPAGVQGTVKELHWRWQDYGVQIDVRDLTVDPETSQASPALASFSLRVESLSVHCNPFLYLWDGSGCLTQVQGRNLALQLDKSLLDSNKSSSPKPAHSLNTYLALLNKLSLLDLQKSSLVVRSGPHEAVRFDVQQAVIHNQPTEHHLKLDVDASREGLMVPLTLAADFTGPADTSQLAGSIALATRSNVEPQLDRLLPADLGADLHQVRGALDFHFQMDRAPGYWKSATLKLGMNRLVWQKAGELHQMALQGGDFSWQHQADGWTLQSHDLKLHTDDQPWRSWEARLSRHGNYYSGHMDALQLKEITPLVAMFLPVGSPAGDILKTMDPQGTLTGLAFASDANHQHWQLSGQLQDVSWQRWQAIPPLAHIQASVTFDPGGVSANIEQTQPQVWDLQPYFSKSWDVEQFAARLHWASGKQGGLIHAESIVLNTKTAQTATQFTLDHPLTTAAELHLKTTASVPDVKNIPQYYPITVMSKPLVDYLSSSIQEGSVHNAEITWDGVLNRFPFADHSGRFRAFVPLRESTFQFDPKWQPLKNLALDLEFLNDRLDMVSHQATLGQADVPRLYAWFDRLEENAHLRIDADVKGDAQAVTRYLTDSPLQPSVGKALAAVQVQHPISGNVKLEIPINGDPVQVSGSVDFANNQVDVPAVGVTMKSAAGKLLFDNTKTAIDTLSGSIDGQPVELHYAGEQKGNNYLVHLTGKGNWSSQRQQWNSSTLAGSFAGQTEWDGRLELNLLPDSHFTYKARITSPLSGLKLMLPFPYQKMAGRSWPLQLDLSGDEQATNIQGHLNREWLLNAVWRPERKQFSRFWLDNLVIESNRDPRPPLSVQVLLSQANLTDWLGWMHGVFNSPETVASAHALLPASGGMSFNIDNLSVADQVWHNVELSVKSASGMQNITINSDNAQGMVTMPADPKQAMQVDLQHLYWADTSDGKKQTPMDVATQQSWLDNWPNMQIICRDCRYSGNTLGMVSGLFIPIQDGGVIKNLQWQVADAQFNGQATWQIFNNRPVSTLKGVFKSKNSETFLSHFSLNPAVTGARTQMDINVNWPGALVQPELGLMNGTIKTKSEEGILRQVKNTNGNRLLSLLSMEAVIKRLSLDFRDIFSEGMYFKKVTFTGKFNHGVLQNDDLVLESNSGELTGQGSINFARNQLDYEITFVPKLTRGSLGVAAAFAITPITGVYVLAATTVLQPVFDMFTQVSYSVKGDISKPVISEISRKRSKVKLASSAKKMETGDATGRATD